MNAATKTILLTGILCGLSSHYTRSAIPIPSSSANSTVFHALFSPQALIAASITAAASAYYYADDTDKNRPLWKKRVALITALGATAIAGSSLAAIMLAPQLNALNSVVDLAKIKIEDREKAHSLIPKKSISQKESFWRSLREWFKDILPTPGYPFNLKDFIPSKIKDFIREPT